ncbi:MAG: hypothetical protein ACTHOD_12315, partial [Motilibacteraceae bacterium]
MSPGGGLAGLGGSELGEGDRDQQSVPGRGGDLAAEGVGDRRHGGDAVECEAEVESLLSGRLTRARVRTICA